MTDKKIELIKGDITKCETEAIVNAANHTLLGGGGVDGAIHRAAGRDLLKECKTLNGCETGKAKITKGYKLPAKYVIHTVGPYYKRGRDNDSLLESAYQSSLEIAEEQGISSIAFPNISTGVYDFPKQRAAEIAIAAVKRFLEKSSVVKRVVFVCFDPENYSIYKKLLAE